MRKDDRVLRSRQLESQSGTKSGDRSTGLIDFAGPLYSYNNGGTGGSLDLRDKPFSGANDLGNPDRTSWATGARDYLYDFADIETHDPDGTYFGGVL